ncbi:MAG: hypothetical protein J4F32_06330 [Dehalococcoidia bacterium]|nr:hypothetical protein [Dehalococcoidia bacterium]
MTDSLRRPLLRTALLLALCSIALTGCFRVELAIRVHEDGSGVVRTVVALEDSFLRLVGEQPADDGPFDPEALPPGAVIEEYRQDGFTGQRVSVEIPDMEQLPQVLAETAVEVSEVVGDLELEREGDDWRFTVIMPPPGEGLANGSGGVGSLEQLGSFLESASYTIRLALPGEVTDHNADRVEDDELVWDIDLTATEPRTLSARSQPPSGLSDWAILAIGIAGAAALILAVGFLVMRSRRQVSPP